MTSLHKKHILLGVTGGIAAYKSAEIIRRLQDKGAEVRVVMTKAAQEFITPLTMQALSGHDVHTELLDPTTEAAMGHIALARWADLVLIAPASADFLARLTQGRGDDLLTTLCLATRAPIAVAPAMNQGMWHNAATQENLTVLGRRNVKIFGPAQGIQACGETGLGRMLEPQDIADLSAQLFQTGALAGQRVLITAGPTQEAIDPVRYLSNHSSGKMGYTLAQAAQEAGADVVLVSGPTYLPAPERVTLVSVISAQEMLEACNQYAFDILIAAAAVADFRPAKMAEQKIKKNAADNNEHLTIELIKNPDIVAELAEKNSHAFCVGFAAETEHLLAHAQEKLTRKKLDMIIANDVAQTHIGFNSDENAVTVICAQPIEGQTKVEFHQRSKQQLARDLIALIAQQMTIKQ